MIWNYLKELAKVETVGQDQVVVLRWKGEIGGVGEVRETEIETLMTGEDVRASNSRGDAGDLKNSRDQVTS